MEQKWSILYEFVTVLMRIVQQITKRVYELHTISTFRAIYLRKPFQLSSWDTEVSSSITLLSVSSHFIQVKSKLLIDCIDKILHFVYLLTCSSYAFHNTSHNNIINKLYCNQGSNCWLWWRSFLFHHVLVMKIT